MDAERATVAERLELVELTLMYLRVSIEEVTRCLGGEPMRLRPPPEDHR